MPDQCQQLTIEFSDGRKVVLAMPVMFTEEQITNGKCRMRHISLSEPIDMPEGSSWSTMKELAQ